MIKAAFLTVTLVIVGLTILILPRYYETFGGGESVFQDFGNWVENPLAIEILRIANKVQKVVSNEFQKLDKVMEVFEKRVRSTVGEVDDEERFVGRLGKFRESILLHWQLLFFVTVFVYGLFFSRQSVKPCSEEHMAEERKKRAKSKKGKKGKRGKRAKKGRGKKR